MRHSIYLHIVWTTAGRRPLIDAPRATVLRRLLRNTAREQRAIVLGLGMVTTHVHVLLRIHPSCNLSNLLQRWKGGSAFVCKRDQVGDPAHPLRWAKGYSVASVSARALPAVRKYLMEQPIHHPLEAIPQPESGPEERDA